MSVNETDNYESLDDLPIETYIKLTLCRVFVIGVTKGKEALPMVKKIEQEMIENIKLYKDGKF